MRRSKNITLKKFHTVSAEKIPFKILQSRDHKDLAKKILQIIESFKLTSEDVVYYFSRTYESSSIKDVLEFLRKKKLFAEVIYNNEYIIRPASLKGLEKENWEKIDRERSKNWVQSAAEYSDIFGKSSKIYSKTVKVKSCNLVLTPNLNQSVRIESGEICEIFSSNDYLGLSKNSRVIQAAKDCIEECGLGSGGSRILSGTSKIHRDLEQKIAGFKDAEDALVLSCGFMTNLAFLALFDSEWDVFFDSLIHTSFLEGMKLSTANGIRFHHNDLNDLELKLKTKSQASKKLIITEGIFSMDGDIGRIGEISALAKKYKAFLAVDEAHSLGTLGENGKGVSEYFNLDKDAIHFKIGTLGKAIGASGGYIAGKRNIIEILRFSAPPFLFSTSLPPSVMAGALEAIKIIEEDNSLTSLLQVRAKNIRDILKEEGFNIGLSESHIIPIIIPNLPKIDAFQRYLERAGIFTNVVTFPAVPIGQSRLRINVSAGHTNDQINYFTNKVIEIGRELEVIEKEIYSFVYNRKIS